MITKEEELQALERIKEILATLGTDSYVATAFEGCVEIAEDNIKNDFMFSFKQRCKHLEERRINEIKDLQIELDYRDRQIDFLNKSRERLVNSCNCFVDQICKKDILISRYEARLREKDR